MDPFNDHIKIAKTINNQLLGTISNEELEYLNSWRKVGKNEALYQEIKAGILSGSYRNELEKLDNEVAWNQNEKRLDKQFRRIRMYKIMRIAAAIILLLAGATTLFYIIQTPVNESAEIAQAITPGKPQAELVLADGSVVGLSDGEKVINEHGAIIKTNKGAVDYHSQNEPVALAAMNTLKVPVGGEYKLTLPDGTQVWLNSVSQLSYPVQFSGNQRKVILQGEAYFQVAHNAKMPFIVATNKGMEVEVLGTSFNMMTYDDEANMETTLVEGSVQVNLSNNKSVPIKPGQQASFNKSSMEVDVKEVDTHLYTAWVDGRFIFEKEDLESVLRKLSRWYDVDVFYQNVSVKHIRFSADVRRYDDVNSLLDLFEQVSSVDFEINDRTILVKEKK
ncbi:MULTISPECIES: FecR family protein [unclassified Saccharicrinis]|uniref:FecR family protein n=1 Tax=unclassified Saccharicrinis TaxID=2646859 RepID=UPI003D3472A8